MLVPCVRLQQRVRELVLPAAAVVAAAVAAAALAAARLPVPRRLPVAIVCDDFYAEAIDEVVEVLKRCLRTSPSRPSWRSGRRRPSSSR